MACKQGFFGGDARLLPESASLEEEALTLEQRGHTGCLSLLSFGFDLCLLICIAIDSWTDSVTRRPYAIDPALLDVDTRRIVLRAWNRASVRPRSGGPDESVRR